MCRHDAVRVRSVSEDDATPLSGADGDQTGENVCPTCGGDGSLAGSTCPTCAGSGRTIEPVGDA